MSVSRTIILFMGLGHACAAAVVTGAAEGFAYGVTGGGDASPVYPADIDELVDLLGSSEPQVIVLSKTYDFTGSEGTTDETGCAPWGTEEGCQLAINANGWCGSNPAAEVSYDNAGLAGITVTSNKTLVGTGSSGVIKGKGLRMTSGASNIIIQNIHITDLNPEYVWGGDAIVLSGTDLIWIDHCQTSLIGRQHYAFGFDPNTRVTLSNNYIDGKTNWSASCDGHHYWTLELVGEGDQITFQNNYLTYTSGRSPALSGTTLFHAVNSVWDSVSGHALEGDSSSARGLFEGCAFAGVAQVAVADFAGQLFAGPDAAARELCAADGALGRACAANAYDEDSDAGNFEGAADDGFLGDFAGYDVPAAAMSAEEARSSVPGSAGIGHL
ncbi:pectin lyase fold/virulence factor [Biscogniauxia mediterranea]|nr:pectin lyase fold/virulence factor [Biscogniauxia mediterranea]